MKGWFDCSRGGVLTLALGVALVLAEAPGFAQRTNAPPRGAAAEVWRGAANMRDPAQRAEVVGRLREIHRARKAEAVRQAGLRGMPIRVEHADGSLIELMDWIDGKPLYYTTVNANAAISTGANLVRAAPHAMDGAGWTVGVWDGGGVRTNHVEFGDRVTIKDKGITSFNDHSTHVAGTIGAKGVKPDVMGMAPAVMIDSYDWDDDASETASRGASYGGEPGKIHLSNHSYAYQAGWLYTTAPKWTWFGSGGTTNSYDPHFGQYNSHSREIDGRLQSLPYYTIVWAAGNDRGDNPANGDTVALDPDVPTMTVAYDSASHPPGDGKYKNGYDTLGFYAVAKNTLTVGAVGDAVTSGVRDPAKAGMTSFSSWGPTDDGRIKPDLVANGYMLYSTLSGTPSSYGYKSGTSMAAPNATGTAQLLLGLYTSMKPGEHLRASTLKALLIHTADDLGTPGPDYKFGWGLVNAKAAADLICTAATNPAVPSIIESQITTAAPVREQVFNWDGVSPIRATICWTDPPGAAVMLNEHDSRDVRLVNDLNLRLVAPDGTTHLPFVMPFVGTWTPESMSAAATTGTNNVDNVEQVLVASPATPGLWKAVVTYAGTLSGNLQDYALIISGARRMPPMVQAVDPDFVAEAGNTVSVLGSHFDDDADVAFFRSGDPEAPAVVEAATSAEIVCTPDLARMGQGFWNVRVTNADGQVGELTNALAVARILARTPFEAAPSGWTSDANIGSTYWTRVTTASHTPPHACFASGPASRNTDNLNSPVYEIPSDATGIRFRFWHRYNTEIYDGCVLEVSPGGLGNWKAIGAAGSGASFVKGGYGGTTIARGWLFRTPAELADQPAWTGDSGSAFTEVVVALDPAIYAGSTLRVRWRLSTDSRIASEGWWVDTVVLHAFSPSLGTLLLMK
ncbi:MAG: S8 family serine peptidase [Kiritimatiellia bacterium]|jgi:hypothetical protein